MALPTRPALSTITTVVDKLVNSFPRPVVTLIVGILTYDTLVERIYQISYIAALMQTTRGGSKLGFFALTFPTTVYATLSPTPFVKPANSGPTPAILMNTTNIKQTAIRYRFTLKTELYMLLQNMDKSLKQQLLGVVEDIYIRSLKEKYVGHGNLTCLEMIDHLKANYYKITLADLKLDTAHMNAPHNINKPFE